jgi:hypothetical protein
MLAKNSFHRLSFGNVHRINLGKFHRENSIRGHGHSPELGLCTRRMYHHRMRIRLVYPCPQLGTVFGLSRTNQLAHGCLPDRMGSGVRSQPGGRRLSGQVVDIRNWYVCLTGAGCGISDHRWCAGRPVLTGHILHTRIHFLRVEFPGARSQASPHEIRQRIRRNPETLPPLKFMIVQFLVDVFKQRISFAEIVLSVQGACKFF